MVPVSPGGDVKRTRIEGEANCGGWFVAWICDRRNAAVVGESSRPHYQPRGILSYPSPCASAAWRHKRNMKSGLVERL